MGGEGLELEIEKLADVERAGLVSLVEVSVARLVHLTVERPFLDEKLRPFESLSPASSVLSRSNNASRTRRIAEVVGWS